MINFRCHFLLFLSRFSVVVTFDGQFDVSVCLPVFWNLYASRTYALFFSLLRLYFGKICAICVAGDFMLSECKILKISIKTTGIRSFVNWKFSEWCFNAHISMLQTASFTCVALNHTNYISESLKWWIIVIIVSQHNFTIKLQIRKKKNEVESSKAISLGLSICDMWLFCFVHKEITCDCGESGGNAEKKVCIVFIM